jgi:4-azaleucine resistance transporter AzlC
MDAAERRILRDGIAIGVAVGVIGASFGVLARTAGLDPLMICAMSALVFAGGSQFLAVAVVASGGGLLPAVVGGLMLNARHIPFGLSLAPVLRGSLGRRLISSQLVIDESTAFALSQPDRRLGRRAFYTVGITLFLCWQVGTALGALAGGTIGDPAALGIDAAFPAGLLALMVPRLREAEARVAALTGAILALAATPLLPAGTPILVASAGAIAGMAVNRSRRP